MTQIVTLGDSITLGMGDPDPSGGWRGWARHLASGLPDPELHNLAVLGAQAKRPLKGAMLFGFAFALAVGFHLIRYLAPV